MNRREAVVQALNHKENEIIPFHMDLSDQSIKQLIEYTSDNDIMNKIGEYLKYKQYWGWPTEMPNKPGYFKDEFGVEWNRNGADKSIGLPDTNIIEDLEFETYTWPKCDEDRLREECRILTENKEADDRFTMYGFGFLMFERSWSIMGIENILINMITAPKETEKFFEQCGDYYCHLLDIALEYDFDGIYFGDDWGQQKGLITGLPNWRKYIKPQMKRLYQKVKDKGLYVMQHSCGDCEELFPELIDIGLDCYQTFQPEIYDIQKIKKEYGNDLSFWGGISTQQVLPFVKPNEVKEEIKKIADILRTNGGYIMAPTHEVAFDVPAKNIVAMIDVFQNQDKYL